MIYWKEKSDKSYVEIRMDLLKAKSFFKIHLENKKISAVICEGIDRNGNVRFSWGIFSFKDWLKELEYGDRDD